jgi:pyruvate-ferredoxin/flavodoxin oxidoreductase
MRGTAHNPDTYFQAREAVNPFYDACPGKVAAVMDRFASLTGRRYRLFDYVGHPEAERVMVIMGSGAEAAHEAVEWMAARGEKVGLVKVRLYRPFHVPALLEALPRTVRAVTVLDRTKEAGAVGDPLWLDVVAAFAEARRLGLRAGLPEPLVTAARYGLSSKEFTPAMVKAALDELGRPTPRSHVTLGIKDDVTHRSLAHDPEFDIEPDDVVRAVFFGLGSDGTVGSNKNTIKIIGEETDLFAQGYFVYDSRKSGSTTVSHLRFGPNPIRSTYLVREASFVGCHHPQFLDRFDVVQMARPGATLLLNTPWKPDEVWDRLSIEVQEQLLEKRIKLVVIDAYAIAEEAGLGRTLGTVMQACFFALAAVLPPSEALDYIKKTIAKSYGKRGEVVVQRNYAAVDLAVQRMTEVKLPARISATRHVPPALADLGRPAPRFVATVTAAMIAGKGDALPVSAFPIDGTWPTGTAEWEKRSTALEIPAWDPAICIQCNKCALICPHAALRTVVFDPSLLSDAPAGFLSTTYKAKEHAGQTYVVQVAPDDCTGCGLCVAFCPAKDKSNPRHKAIDMVDASDATGRKTLERDRFAFLGTVPPVDRRKVHLDVKGSQLLEPLFEFSGACAGCGETPYLKLLSQLFGDRTIVANATGCSSIYGGNLPTTPWRKDAQGRGPAWSNSLFEDNAEYGLGMRLAIDARRDHARRLLRALSAQVGGELATALIEGPQRDETQIQERRAQVVELQRKLAGIDGPEARDLADAADYLVKKSVWIIGGDGWAYDIGFGGLDHVLASGLDVNVLVLDTEVYSNTGGQQSKATPTGAAAKFAASGKEVPKKDLALLATTYGHVYVARVAMGAKDKQTLDAMLEAESWHGPSLIIAYSHCIAHGYDMAHGADQQRLAVDSGVWPLFRYDPRRVAAGEPAVVLDSGTGPSKTRVVDYMRNEGRFRVVELQDPKRFERLAKSAQDQAERRLSFYRQLAGIRLPVATGAESAKEAK